MFLFKQIQTVANNSLAIWRRPEPLLTRAKLSWKYQQQCLRVLQHHISGCLTDLANLPQQLIQLHEGAPITPIVTLNGFAGQTLTSAFLLQNDQESEVEFSLIVESILLISDTKTATDRISVEIQPAHGKLRGSGAEPIQLAVQIHATAQAGDYVAVVRIHGVVEQVCHVNIQVQSSNKSAKESLY